MTGKRLTELSELNETPAVGDLVHLVDVSDTTDHESGTSKKITVANLASASLPLQQALSDGENIAWDLASGANATVTLGGNRTLSNPTNGVTGAACTLLVKQDGEGSRSLSFGNNYVFPGGVAPQPGRTASMTSVYQFYYNGSKMILINFVTGLTGV